MILDEKTFESLGKNFSQANQKEKIFCKCDYCGEVFERMKHNIERSHKVTQSDSCSNKICVQKKRIESNRILFGTDNGFQNENIKAAIKNTVKIKYGVDNVMKNPDIKKRQEDSCEKTLGTRNPFGSTEIQNRIAEKNILKYGVKNPTQNASIKNKQENTNEIIYGVRHALQLEAFRQKAMETCLSNHGKFPVSNYGKTQKEIEEWLNSFGFNFQSNRSLVQGFEIDMYDSAKKIAIEYCGLNWHHEFSSESRKNPKYHYNKYKKCMENQVQLLTIFSDEWLDRQEQCKGHIKAILGINDIRIFARHCKITEINKKTGRDFFEKYHIQGKNSLGFIFFGLFYKDELVGAISLGRHNRQYDNLVLDRLCFKEGVQIVGGASKLFSKCITWAKQNNHKSIISFSDNRWSVGNVYKALNFKMEKEYYPDYCYVNVKSPTKRISKQSQKKSNTNCPKEMTEYAWAHQHGLARIWDCGKIRWKFNL